MEPKMNEEERNVKNRVFSADTLKKYYTLGLVDLDWAFGKSQTVTVGKINASPAPNAQLFQIITKYLSRILWIFPLLFIKYPLKIKVSFFKRGNL